MAHDLKKELTESLMGIYSINIIPFLAGFLEGEQAVLIALLRLKLIAPTDICKVTGIAKNRMSAIVNSLKKKDYISVSPEITDKRKIKLTLTTAGEKFISAKEAEAGMIFDSFIKAVGEDNTKELIRIVNLAVENIKGQI